VDGTFEALLPPGSWHLLVNAPQPVYLPAKIALDRLTDEEHTVGDGVHLILTDGSVRKVGAPPTRDFYPDAHVAVDFRPGAASHAVNVTLQRAPVLRGRVVGPDGMPLQKVRMLGWPTPPPATPIPDDLAMRRMWLDLTGRAAAPDIHHWVSDLYGGPRSQPGPFELADGTFAIPVLDRAATYRLHFLDATSRYGAVAELKGTQARQPEVTVRLAPCGDARAQFVDGSGKPLTDYRPLLTLLFPPGPHAIPKDLKAVIASNLCGPDWVWAGHVDAAHHGKGPRTDTEGRVTFGGLIPGATYRLLLGGGAATDFTAQAGKSIELPRLAVADPAATAKLPVIQAGK
jgi:hypothetical protein